MMGKGAILLVLGFGLVFGIIGARLGGLQNRAIDNMSYYHDITKSHNLASIGINAAMSRVYQDSTLRGQVTTQSFSSGFLKGGAFTARVDSLDPTRLRVRSVSQFQGMNDTVEVYLDFQKFNSFSMFAWMTITENGVWWITGDTVWGRVHSNGTININGKPVFMEKATTSKQFNPKPGKGTNKAVYKKGYETGVAPIAFPNDISDIVNASTAGGRKYTTNVYVTLDGKTGTSGDGMAYIRTTATGPIVDSISLADPSFNGVLYSTQYVYVQGKLDGKMTIASQKNVVITNDVVYEQNPLYGPSDDMLGLVAEKSVVVADNAANNNNCEIHASIFSRTQSFMAENYASRPVSGWLKLVGGIVQDTRGPVGTFSGSTLISGFSKRYYYDSRLADPNTRPPSFPGFYRRTFAIADWWESVRIPQF